MSSLAEKESVLRSRHAAFLAAAGGDAADRAGNLGLGALVSGDAVTLQGMMAIWILGVWTPKSIVYLAASPTLCKAKDPLCEDGAGDVAVEANRLLFLFSEYNAAVDESSRYLELARGSGRTEAIRRTAGELKDSLVATRTAVTSCFDEVKKTTPAFTKLSTPLPVGTGLEMDLGGYDFKLENGAFAATPTSAAVSGTLVFSTRGTPQVRARVRDASFVFQTGVGPLTAPTGPRPTRVNGVVKKSYASVRGSGKLDVTINGTTYDIGRVNFNSATDGSIGILTGDTAITSCRQQLGPGSRLMPDALVLEGSFKCGNVLLANASARIGSTRAVKGTLTTYGHTFDMELSFAAGEASGTASWKGASTEWQKLPGDSRLEYRVTGPMMKVSMQGPVVSATLGVDKVELQTTARTPQGQPVARGEINPGSFTVAADGTVPVRLPPLPPPPDPNKVARDACVASANKLPAGNARDTALAACTASNPPPPPNPPSPPSITVNVQVVIK